MSGDGNRIDQSRTVNNYYGLPEAKPAPSRRDRNEKTLINAVWTEVDDRLRQSLHNAILIRLDMAEQRSQVSRPWDAELRTAEQRSKPLAPGTPIAEVFDRTDVGGKLLILGNPGAGKTTTMLDMAATLVQRANGDADEPIPVMVNLSSWQNSKQSFTDWLLNELKLKYGISAKLGQTWLSEKKLLPLLDGLDELPPARQAPVVQAINTWLQSEAGAPRLLVCSRIEEYELYAEKLDLNGAICLNPLTDEQLHDYLASLQMESLWDTLQHDADLLALVRTPLLLSVTILANDDLDEKHLSQLQTTQERLDYLLDAYIGRRLHEPVASKAYLPGKQPTAQQTRHWLVWLARQLKTQSEDEFLIENIQPSTLKQKHRHINYIILFLVLRGLPLALTVLSAGIIVIFLRLSSLIDGNEMTSMPKPNFAWILSFLSTAFSLAWIIGIIIGLIINFESIHSIKTIERLCFSQNAFKKFVFSFGKNQSFNLSMLKGIILGFFFSVTIHLWGNDAVKGSLENSVSISLPFAKLSGIFWFGVTSGGLLGFCLGISNEMIDSLKSSMTQKEIPNSGIIQSIKNVPILLILSTFLTTFIFCLFSLIAEKDFSGLLSTIFLGLVILPFLLVFSEGMLPFFQHLALRIILYFSREIPWNYARFLNHCTDRLLLQRVGGRYRFIHRLVQERFAAMPLESRRVGR